MSSTNNTTYNDDSYSSSTYSQPGDSEQMMCSMAENRPRTLSPKRRLPSLYAHSPEFGVKVDIIDRNAKPLKSSTRKRKFAKNSEVPSNTPRRLAPPQPDVPNATQLSSSSSSSTFFDRKTAAAHPLSQNKLPAFPASSQPTPAYEDEPSLMPPSVTVCQLLKGHSSITHSILMHRRSSFWEVSTQLGGIAEIASQIRAQMEKDRGVPVARFWGFPDELKRLEEAMGRIERKDFKSLDGAVERRSVIEIKWNNVS